MIIYKIFKNKCSKFIFFKSKMIIVFKEKAHLIKKIKWKNKYKSK